ncbi:hypothetical protein VO56_01535 [Mycoplasmopsis gallinacea]|uniref:DNA polymerase III subunit delta n=1 Tax=Mycoplasmopsis gallinacea TaxID=29556 RepID=A0A0D5ZJR1_9BACT|nr:hypothetical protein VO56_01535 [Mycoplasmopsis gallinacea]
MLSQKVINDLKNAKANNMLSHLYILEASPILEIHNDLLIFLNELFELNLTSLDPENLAQNLYYIDGKNHKIEKEIVQQFFYNASFRESGNPKEKIILIENIENASLSVLNSMLKNIEEPTDNLVIILTTNNINKVLPTIISRAQVIKIIPENPVNIYNQINFLDDNIHKILCSLSFDNFEKLQNFSFNNKIDSILSEFLVAIQNSTKNKEYLYLYLTKKLTKENWVLNKFLLKTIIVLVKQTWNFYPFNVRKSEIEKLNKLSNKLNEAIKNPFLIIETIEKFFTKAKKELNFNISKENFLIEIMECYG